jgi:hypothetical protein
MDNRRLAPRAVDMQDTPLLLTCTTTGAETLTLAGMTVAAGKTVVVDWGDGNTNTYTAGAGTRTHAYAGVGTWTVKLANRRNIVELSFMDAKIGATINAANPWPVNLTTLYVNYVPIVWTVSAAAPIPVSLTALLLALSGTIWTVSSTTPMPSGLTTLILMQENYLYWTISAAAPIPAGMTTNFRLYYCPHITGTISATAPMPTGLLVFELTNTQASVEVGQWAVIRSIHSIVYKNTLAAGSVDAVLGAIWANKANYTYATPTLNLLGISNAAPSGTYQAASPPTTGKEYAYDLVNGSYTPAGPEWVVQTA